jgi:hypothetical protein
MHQDSPPSCVDETSESGQAAVSLLLMMGIFLLGTLALAVDFTNIWFHRQAEQGAADAACQAGAMDLLVSADGTSLPSMGYTAGVANDCVTASSATMCTYANANGYDGTGLVAGSASNRVSWTFPSSFTGVTAPPAAQAPHPFLAVTIAENVRTFFVGLFNLSTVQQIDVTATCGLIQVKSAAPMLVLHPTMSGAFTYNGGANLTIYGGPSRGLQVNSSSATGVNWAASGTANLSAGGANYTGADMAVVGGPAMNPSNGGSNYAYNGGSTGTWKSGVQAIADPYAGVAAPASVRSQTPVNTTSGKWVAYGTDDCPDHSNSHYPVSHACMEFTPGYYPSGINLPDNYSTAIFTPGVYYINGSLNASGSNTLRMAKPSGYQRTDGVMFYFYSGSLNISGCSGCSSSNVDVVQTTDLTCDGSMPIAGAPSTLSGNVLIAQCTSNGTYWDNGGDTSDSRGSPGVRGLLLFHDHSNTTAPQFTGSGALTSAGVLYFHSTSYQDVLSLNNGSTFWVVGQIVTDQLNLTGSGSIVLVLNGVPSAGVMKAALLQ